MESSAVKQRANVTEINRVVRERKRRKSQHQRLGAWDRGGKTMLLGIIGVAMVSIFCSGGERRSLVSVYTTIAVLSTLSSTW